MVDRSPQKKSRRQALAATGGAVGGVLLAASPLFDGAAGAAASVASEHHHGHLPVHDIEEIVEAEGSVSGGVLSIGISRDDIGDVKGPMGVTFTPAFEVDGTLTFQPLHGGRAFFNGDLALKVDETNPVIDAIIENDLVFQAFHQHYDDMDPQIWFIHFRGTGTPRKLARSVRKVLAATSTPLPQTPPEHPTTSLDPDRLAAILHGDAEVGDEGVVTVTVPRNDTIVVDGIQVSPEANISTVIEIKPLDFVGHVAAVAPDFSLRSDEIQRVVATMRKDAFHVGCLYNQETAETPQLYFAHMVKVGEPYVLAHEIRRALDHTRSA
ncbi:MAG: hypothetical protein JWM89_1249 [Acidimicrobiales bacterium]|nr:hypothetical protein [Acidimicrobiales bacterium]